MERGPIIVTGPRSFPSIAHPTDSQMQFARVLAKTSKDLHQARLVILIVRASEKIVRRVLRDMAGGFFAIGFDAGR